MANAVGDMALGACRRLCRFYWDVSWSTDRNKPECCAYPLQLGFSSCRHSNLRTKAQNTAAQSDFSLCAAVVY